MRIRRITKVCLKLWQIYASSSPHLPHTLPAAYTPGYIHSRLHTLHATYTPGYIYSLLRTLPATYTLGLIHSLLRILPATYAIAIMRFHWVTVTESRSQTRQKYSKSTWKPQTLYTLYSQIVITKGSLSLMRSNYYAIFDAAYLTSKASLLSVV